ncbi:hypothetical protein Tco_0993063 [Tanacetum coccineum]|uniref:Uncharacterized protein n=1 Tax=Tanacetum coccineum TaxID=301880 RepID=A0ABQ5F503_9ASTR
MHRSGPQRSLQDTCGRSGSDRVGTTDTTTLPVIENGDSWVSVSQTSKENGITVTKMYTPVTAKEKKNKKNNVKARGLLLMALPNDKPAKLCQYPDANSITNDVTCLLRKFSAASPCASNTLPVTSLRCKCSDNLIILYDLDAMDLKWLLSLLSVESKEVECYNVISGTLCRECKAPRSKEGQFRNQDNTRKQGNNEDTSKAMLAINGVGFDWSDMAEEQPEFKGYGPENNKKESNVVCNKESENSKDNFVKSLVEEQVSQGKPQLDDKGFVDSGCSRHMTGNIAYLYDFKQKISTARQMLILLRSHEHRVCKLVSILDLLRWSSLFIQPISMDVKECYIIEYVQKDQNTFRHSKKVGTPRYLNLVVPLIKVDDEAVNKELGDIMERVAATASSLEDSCWISSIDPPTPKRLTHLEVGGQGRDLHLDDAEGTDCLPTATIFEEWHVVPTPSNDPQASGEDSMKLTDLMVLCTKLQTQVLDLEKPRMLCRRLLFADEDPRIVWVLLKMHLQERSIEILVLMLMGLWLMKLKRDKIKDQIALDEQIARDIQAKLDAELIEEQKLARKQEEEANIELIKSWENTQALIEADRLLAERLLFKEKRVIDSENKEKKEEGREETTKSSRKKMLGRKRAGKEQQKESSKKQKVEEEKESEDRCCKNQTREDLEALWRIVKAKYGDTRPENEFERVLYGDLKDCWVLKGLHLEILRIYAMHSVAGGKDYNLFEDFLCQRDKEEIKEIKIVCREQEYV